MVIYSITNWGKLLHAGANMRSDFILFKEGNEVNEEIFKIEGIKAIHIIKHSWITIVIELMNTESLEKLYSLGFKLGLKVNKRYKKLEKQGFSIISEII